LYTEEGGKLAVLIEKAIAAQELTTTEYDEIITQAYADGEIDPHEDQLLKEMQDLIAHGIIRRVPD